MNSRFPLNKLQSIKTPYYYYDIDLLEQTLTKVRQEAGKYGFVVHYAIDRKSTRLNSSH